MGKMIRVTMNVEFYDSENPLGHFGDQPDVAWRESFKAEDFTPYQFRESVIAISSMLAKDLEEMDAFAEGEPHQTPPLKAELSSAGTLSCSAAAASVQSPPPP